MTDGFSLIPVYCPRHWIGTAAGLLGLAATACAADPAEANRVRQLLNARNTANPVQPNQGDCQDLPWVLRQELPGLRQATARDRSQHLTGELQGEILVNELAGAYPHLSLQRTMPVGAILVEVHYPPGSNDPAVFFVMRKHTHGFDPAGDDWEYLTVRPNGDIEQQGKLALCRRCHAEAPRGFLFGRMP